MKKKLHFLGKLLSTLSICILLTGCTSLEYIDSDFDKEKVSNVTTKEMFNVSLYEKNIENVSVKAGITQTPLDHALLLYMGIKNNSDTTFQFNINDVIVTSPIGEVSFIKPLYFIEAYQSYESSMYASAMNATTAISSFANIQNMYRTQKEMTGQYNSTAESIGITPELKQLEDTIKGIQQHAIKTTAYVSPDSYEYFYIFLNNPEEYPIVVKYKDLTYKFGGKKNEEK